MFELDYMELVNTVIKQGSPRESRAGDTRYVFGTKLVIGDLRIGKFPILTTRKMYPKGIWGELAAFLQGATTLQEFQDLGCNYWNANASSWGANRGLSEERMLVGKIYGAQWRDFNGVDQIDGLYYSLKNEPHSRRHLLTTYNPAELGMGCLPPCHLLAQFNVTNDLELECIVYMRSVDLCIGLPTDIVLYASLLIVMSEWLGFEPGRLIFMMGDTHVYEDHVPIWLTQHAFRARRKLPSYTYKAELQGANNFHPRQFKLEDYTHDTAIEYPFHA